MDPTTRETACFEAGVKFGSLYHQFAGTPVSPATAADLATAMESAIANQPYCRSVSVTVRENALAADLDDEHGYAELSGRHYDAEVIVDYEGVEVVARMATTGSYPRMWVEAVRSDD